jgi:DNA-binding NarL/FixJ family response regulator
LIHIILADHHAHPRWALGLLLGEQPEFNVIGEAVDAQNLLLLAGAQTANLVLVDQELPGIKIEDLIARLHEIQPRPVVIVMSSKSDNSIPMLQAGADAFVSKTDQPELLLETLYKYARQIDAMKDAGQENASHHIE